MLLSFIFISLFHTQTGTYAVPESMEYGGEILVNKPANFIYIGYQSLPHKFNQSIILLVLLAQSLEMVKGVHRS